MANVQLQILVEGTVVNGWDYIFIEDQEGVHTVTGMFNASASNVITVKTVQDQTSTGNGIITNFSLVRVSDEYCGGE